MGREIDRTEITDDMIRRFTKAVLTDLLALEKMLEENILEEGVHRIGAEQELFLIDKHYQPFPIGTKVLEKLENSRFTTELALFNLEFNLEPIDWQPNCLSLLHKKLKEQLSFLEKPLKELNADFILVGILPTIDKSDLSLENMTPLKRYFAINEAMTRLRGGSFTLYLKGADEIFITHDNILIEGVNTSFQVHFQVDPSNFANLYNLSQVTAAPLMAASTNSPLLFGKRLWRETRIAVFQQAIDTRLPGFGVRDRVPRVRFGSDWVHESILEIYREDIARFRTLLAVEVKENPLDILEKGEIPKLEALSLFNGTVYRWNRACYGVYKGKPHLRIELRIFPSGPTVVDEVANAAFWFGLIKGLQNYIGDVKKKFVFQDVRENFVAAARLGLKAQLTWLDKKIVPAGELILKELLPLAREGLKARSIAQEDIDTYLGIVEERVKRQITGADWILDAYNGLSTKYPLGERLIYVTKGITINQKTDKPVHEWEKIEKIVKKPKLYVRTVAQIMTRDLFTVNAEDTVDLVAALMDWRKIRYVPVETNDHKLVGLVTHRSILRLVAKNKGFLPNEGIPVREIMKTDIITVSPKTSVLEAIELMRRNQIGCLPVVESNNELVGIVTERDFLYLARDLLIDALTEVNKVDSGS